MTKLATSKDTKLLHLVLVEIILKPSIAKRDLVETIDSEPSWMDEIVIYLKEDKLPENREQARRVRYHAEHYLLLNDRLYKRGVLTPLLRCLNGKEAKEVLSQIHDGVSGNHTRGQSLAHKALLQGFFWPTMKQDAADYAKKCDKCQRYSALISAHPERLTVIFCPWSFAKCGINIIDPLPTVPGGLKFAAVAMDYFTKWAEAIPLSIITEKNMSKFIREHIIYRFGIPHSLVSDNDLQFDNLAVRGLCDQFGINKDFSTPYHPQSDGQVEAVNKIIKFTLKRRLDTLKRRWATELPLVLWSYRTTARTATGETPFSMAYVVEAMIPAEVKVPSFR